jgi:hypothetical protein
MNKLKLFLVAAFLLSVQLAAAQTTAALKLAAKYEMPASVKGRFDHLGIGIGGNRLFVVGEEAQQVLVFDLATGKFIRAIKVDHPHRGKAVSLCAAFKNATDLTRKGEESRE